MNIFIVISVVSIVSLLVYIPLKLSEVLPIRNMYRPPLSFNEWKRRKKIIEDDEDKQVDPDLIQYWPGLFTDNDF